MPKQSISGGSPTESQLIEKTGVIDSDSGGDTETDNIDDVGALTQHLLLKAEAKPEAVETDDKGEDVAPEGEEEPVENTETADEAVDGESTDEPKPEADTETTVVDYENVLSKLDLSALDPDVLNSVNEEFEKLSSSKVEKRIRDLNSAKKYAERDRDMAVQDLTEYKETHATPKTEVRVEGENPFRHTDRTELNKLVTSWQEVKDQAQDAMTNGLHPEDIVMTVQTKDGSEEITKERMGIKLAEARKNLTQNFPDQIRFLEKRDQFRTLQPKEFPWVKNKTSAEYQQLERIKASPTFAGMLQNHAAGELIGPILAQWWVRERGNTAVKKVVTKAPPTQATRVSTPKKTTRIKSTTKESTRKTARDQLSAAGGGKSALASYLRKTR